MKVNKPLLIVKTLLSLSFSGQAATLITGNQSTSGTYAVSADTTITSTGKLTINSSAASPLIINRGIFIVDGGTLSATSNAQSWTGRTGLWTFNIINGGVVTLPVNLQLSQFFAGSMLIDGDNSTLNSPGIQIGRNSNVASVTLSNNGAINATSVVSVGSGGTLNIGSAASTTAVSPGMINTPQVYIAPSGVLTFNHTSNSYTFSPNITQGGSGSTINILSGKTIFTGNNAGFVGTINIINGDLEISRDANLSSSNINVNINDGTLFTTGTLHLLNPFALQANGATLDVASGTTTSLDGAITGAGAVMKNNGGVLILSANNTYSGGTTINAGTLQLGNGSTAGSITGNIVNNGELAVNRSNTLTQSGVISGSGSFQQNGTGTTILTADNTYTGGTTINAGTLQLGNGGASGNVAGDIINNGIVAVNRSDELLFPGNISGSGALHKDGPGGLTLTGQYSLTGGTWVNAGSLTFSGNTVTTNIIGQPGAAFNLQNNALLNGWIDPLDVNIDASSTWNMQGGTNDNILNTLSLAGRIISAPPSSPTTFQPRNLTVSNLDGKSGSITLNTVLADSNAPSDRIIIEGGNAAGKTVLNINNIAGQGAETAGNGILLVQSHNGGTTAADAFVMNKPLYLGAWQYSLVRGGKNGDAAQDWFLTSDMLRPTADGTSQVASDIPNYRPGVSVAAAAPLIGSSNQVAMVSGFYGPAADSISPRCEQSFTLKCDAQSPVWGRYINNNVHHNSDGKGVAGNSGPKYNQVMNGIQLGGDVWRRTSDRGIKQYAGFYGALGTGKTDVSTINGTSAGQNHEDIYSLGLYYSQTHQNNAWIGAVFQGSWFKVRGKSFDDRASFGSVGRGVVSTLEGGYPVFNDHGWVIEPHLRALYQYQSMSNTSDGLSDIQFDHFQSLQSLVGVRVSQSGLIRNNAYSLWLDVSEGHEFLGDATTHFMIPGQDVSVTTKTKGDFADVKVGGSLNLSQDLTAYASTVWTPRFDGTGYGLGGSFGLRGTW